MMDDDLENIEKTSAETLTAPRAHRQKSRQELQVRQSGDESGKRESVGVSGLTDIAKGITEKMTRNAQKLVDNIADIEKLEEQAEGIEKNAEIFHKVSKEITWKYKCQKHKWKIILAMLLILVLGAIIGGAFLFHHLSTSGEQKRGESGATKAPGNT